MRSRSGAFFGLVLVLHTTVSAQSILQDMPRYEQFRKLSAAKTYVSGAATVRWDSEKNRAYIRQDGKTKTFDLASGQFSTEPAPEEAGIQRGSSGPARGRQFDTATAGDWTAISRDRNIFVKSKNGPETQITKDGSVPNRIKNGTASWVYGEELNVREAMWWSPDATLLAYYRFDETEVKDYFMALDQTKFQTVLDVEAYPKAGTPNPSVKLMVWNRETGVTVAIDTVNGDAAMTEYVYDVRWSPKGNQLLFNRTNRRQNRMQLCASDPLTGKTRVVAEESQPQSWAENHPEVRFLSDGRRFIWSSERNGYKNFFLYDLEKGELGPITRLSRDAMDITAVDEDGGQVFYTAAGPKNPYFIQFHVVNLDGTKDQLLTDPEFHHSVNLSPDRKHFSAVRQRPDAAPETLIYRNLRDKVTVATSDLTEFERLGLKRTELFTYPAADGKTELFGTVQFPSFFDPKAKYPVILSVYAGPESGGPRVQFAAPSALTELGFIVVNLAGRGTNGRGKSFRDAVYGKLGIVEIDDQAAGIRALGQRPYIDLKRVGVYGTSYGGYASIMLLLRHPDLFRSAAASSSVTDWRHYDTIYTERYNGLPGQDHNQDGYDAGSAFKYVSQLKGNLMLFFGSSDNNVHPANTYMLVQALDRAGKRYEMQVGPDQGHTQMNSNRMWEFFIRTLVLDPKSRPQAAMIPGGLRAKRKEQIG